MAEESGKAAQALADYLSMGPSRSLAKLAEKYGRNTTYVRQLERWSSEFDWVARAKAHDAEVAQARHQKREEAIDAMNKEQWEHARQQRIKSHQRIMQLLDKDKLSLYATSQIFKNAADIERLALEGNELVRRIEALEQLLKGNVYHE